MSQLSQRLLDQSYQAIPPEVFATESSGWYHDETKLSSSQFGKIKVAQGIPFEVIENRDELHPEFKRSSAVLPNSDHLVKIHLGAKSHLDPDRALITVEFVNFDNLLYSGRQVEKVTETFQVVHSIVTKPTDVIYIGSYVLDGLFLMCQACDGLCENINIDFKTLSHLSTFAPGMLKSEYYVQNLEGHTGQLLYQIVDRDKSKTDQALSNGFWMMDECGNLR